MDEKPLTIDILEISPHRVYLVSLQLNLYILSVALVLENSEKIQSKLTDVIRYASLWCPDFPLYSELDSEPFQVLKQVQHKTIRRSAAQK